MGYNNLFYWLYNYFSLPNYKGYNNLFLLGTPIALFDQIIIGYITTYF